MLTKTERLILTQAFDEKDRMYFASLPSYEELRKITFSKKFERRMQRLLRRADKIYYPMINTLSKRVACVALSITLLLSVTTLSVKALREPFFQFIVETYETFTDLFFPKEEPSSSFVPVAPTYIPEGYSERSRKTDHVSITITYQNELGQSLDYMQLLNGGGITTSVDTENAITHKLMLKNSTEAILVEKNGYKQIIFRNDNCIFELIGVISQEELIKAAESLIN